MIIMLNRRRALFAVAACMALVIGAFSVLHSGAAASVSAPVGNWGLSFPNPGDTPVGNASAAVLKEKNAFYMGDPGEKKIYLTFDAGYENGNTAPLLDALKKHGVSATFFVVGHFLETAPELVKRMVAEGHTVGNHTFHHPDMASIADKKAFAAELTAVEEQYQSLIGEPMAKIYRPPQGKYSESNLTMACEMGYTTFFWSLAYVDWYTDNQPTAQQAYDKLLSRIHPGAIVLLHSTSATNAAILDDLLTKWEDSGYSFGKLSELYEV